MSDIWEYGEEAGTGHGDLARGPAGSPAAGETPEPVTGADERFPWPPPEDGSILAAFGGAWRSATFDPGRFFARIPREGGTGAAILYYLVIGLLVAGATLFWDVLGRFASTGARETIAEELGFGTVAPVTSFLLSPLVLMAALLLSAAVVHGILALFDGARHSFGTTIRVFCYAYSPMIFGVVPVLGALVGSLWMLVLSVIGLREAHQTDGWKAAVAVVLPFVLLVGLLLLMVLTILAAGAALVPG